MKKSANMNDEKIIINPHTAGGGDTALWCYAYTIVVIIDHHFSRQPGWMNKFTEAQK